MNRQPDVFEKMYLFTAAILLYQSSLGPKDFVKLKKSQLLYLVMKLTKPLLHQRLAPDEKLGEVLVSHFSY